MAGAHRLEDPDAVPEASELEVGPGQSRLGGEVLLRESVDPVDQVTREVVEETGFSER